MHVFICTSFGRPFRALALTLALLSSVNMVSAQSTPAPAAPAPSAPPLAAPPPAPQAAPPPAYPAAPPPQQPYYAPQRPQQPYYAPPPQQGQQPYYAPPQGAYQQPYNSAQPYSGPYTSMYRTAQPRPRRGMMITGASILGGSYLLSMFVGSIVLDDRDRGWDGDDDCPNCRAVGRWLFVPIVGPFVAMSQTHEGDPGLWLLGMLQLVGVGLTTGGIIRYKNSKAALEAQGLSWNLGQDRKLTLDVQSGLRSVGPRMRIDF